MGRSSPASWEKSAATGGGIIGIVGVAVAFLDPDRLLCELPGGLQIVRIELLRNDVVVGIQRGSGLFFFFNFAGSTGVKDVSGAACGDQDGKHQHQLNASFEFGIHGFLLNLSDFPGKALNRKGREGRKEDLYALQFVAG